MIAACPKCGARYRIERGKLRRDGHAAALLALRGRVSREPAAGRAPSRPRRSPSRGGRPRSRCAASAPEPLARADGVRSRERLVLVADAEVEAGKAIAGALVDGGLAAAARPRRRRGDPHDPAHAAAGRGARRRAAEDVRLPGLRADEAQREPARHPGGADRRDPPSRPLPARAQRDLRRRRLPRAPPAPREPAARRCAGFGLPVGERRERARRRARRRPAPLRRAAARAPRRERRRRAAARRPRARPPGACRAAEPPRSAPAGGSRAGRGDRAARSGWRASSSRTSSSTTRRSSTRRSAPAT